MADSSLKLYTYFHSSCSARVRIALNLKGISYSSTPIDITKGEQFSETFTAVNPSRLVPALKLQDGTILTQSTAILEYVEEAYPDSKSLLPPKDDVLGRALVRTLVGVVACDIQPVTNDRIQKRIEALGGSREEYVSGLVKEGLKAYESLAKSKAGKFSFGDEVTLADVFLIPAIWNAERVGIDLSDYPTVERVYKRLSDLDAVKKGHWKNQEDTPYDLRE